MPVDVSGTNTRLFLPPAQVTAEALGELEADAAALVREAMLGESPTLVVEDAHPIDATTVRSGGRHRANEDLKTKTITPTVRERVLGVPLPSRAAGAALAASTDHETRRLSGPARLLAMCLKALPRGFRWGA